jgi:hypothetical protein
MINARAGIRGPPSISTVYHAIAWPEPDLALLVRHLIEHAHHHATSTQTDDGPG